MPTGCCRSRAGESPRARRASRGAARPIRRRSGMRSVRELDRLFDERLDRASSPHAILLSRNLSRARRAGLGPRRAHPRQAGALGLAAPCNSPDQHQEPHDDVGVHQGGRRLAMRQCRRAPLFAILTVASLALGIGANSAMFGVVEAVLLQPLPVHGPGERWSRSGATTPRLGETNNPVSPADYEAFKAAPSLHRSKAWTRSVNAGADPMSTAEPEPVDGLDRSPRACSRCSVGRRSRSQVRSIPVRPQGTVLSHRFWQRRFGGDPSVIGTDARAGEPVRRKRARSSASCRRTSPFPYRLDARHDQGSPRSVRSTCGCR